MKKRTLGFSVLGALATLAFAASASATVMVELSLEELVRGADTIVHASVIDTGVQMRLSANSMEPQTITTLRVHEWIAGAGADTVEVRELGGVWQGGGLRFDGTPGFARGEEVVLFLERRPDAPHDLRTLGMVQGKFIVRHGVGGVTSTVHRDLPGIAFASWSSGRQVISAPGQQPVMQLDTFLDYVRRLRAEGGGR